MKRTPLYADLEVLAEADRVLRSSVPRGDEVADVLAKALTDRAGAAARGRANALAYSAEIDECLAEAARDLSLHMITPTAGVRVLRRRIELAGLAMFGLRRMPSDQRLHKFVAKRAEEQRNDTLRATSLCGLERAG